mmetsp:Transcript_39193/g.126766  ORF Transcript_39193/g.126766 Transcript_39193/m.126766 type:complete len:406 (+) Transcript_39193:280-1497(+)
MIASNCELHMKLKASGTRRSKKASDSCSSSLPMQRHAALIDAGRTASGRETTRRAAVAAHEKPWRTTDLKPPTAGATSSPAAASPAGRPHRATRSMVATRSGTWTAAKSYGSPHAPRERSVPRACTRTHVNPRAASGWKVASSTLVVMKESGYGAKSTSAISSAAASRLAVGSPRQTRAWSIVTFSPPSAGASAAQCAPSAGVVGTGRNVSYTTTLTRAAAASSGSLAAAWCVRLLAAEAPACARCSSESAAILRSMAAARRAGVRISKTSPIASSTSKLRVHAATSRPAESELPPSSPKSSSTPTLHSVAPPLPPPSVMYCAKRLTTSVSVGVPGARKAEVRSDWPASIAAYAEGRWRLSILPVGSSGSTLTGTKRWGTANEGSASRSDAASVRCTPAKLRLLP